MCSGPCWVGRESLPLPAASLKERPTINSAAGNRWEINKGLAAERIVWPHQKEL